MTIQVVKHGMCFSELHREMQSYVDSKRIPFASTLIVKGGEVVDLKHYRDDTKFHAAINSTSIFRANSVTKIVTSLAIMMLKERGDLSLDDPLAKYIPEFSEMKVLKAGNTDAQIFEDAARPMTLRHLLSHTAGLSYGFVEPESAIDRIYNDNGINPLLISPDSTLEQFCSRLAQMPLAYQPGDGWRYSFANDVLARVVEVVSGKTFDVFLRANILDPLGMTDTDFYVPKEKQHRFLPAYTLQDPSTYSSSVGGIMDSPAEGLYSRPVRFFSGGGGLVSTLEDCYRLLMLLLSEGAIDGKRLVNSESLGLMRENHCPEGKYAESPSWRMPHTKFGLGFAIKQQPDEGEPDSAIGEYHWGGVFGLHLWISPKADIAGICMTQVFPGFLHPFSLSFKKLAYQIAATDIR